MTEKYVGSDFYDIIGGVGHSNTAFVCVY